MTKEELLDWANETIKLYNDIADKHGKEKIPAFYTQSDLRKIVGRKSVDVLIAGINPGSNGTYQGMIDNPNWGIDTQSGMTAEQLISGNFCRNPKHENCTSWSLHHTWDYFRNLKKYFQEIGDSNILDDESRFVLTNATFFNTSKEKDLDQSLLEATFPQTLDLIKRVNPKMVIWLSGEKSFKRLSSILIGDLIFKYDKKANPVIGRIYMGTLNGIPCFGVPHPAFKTNEEKLLVAKFLSYVFGYRNIEDIKIEDLKAFCLQEFQAYQKRIKEGKPIVAKIDFKRVEQSILNKMNDYIYNNGNRIRKNKNAQYGITIAQSQIFVRQAYEDTPNGLQLNPNDDTIIKRLQSRGYVRYKVWLGKRKLSDFGNSEDEIVQKVSKEIEELFEQLDIDNK